MRIDLFDVAPKDLQKKIQKRMSVRNMESSFGYCRRMEMESKMIMPDYLKRIVCSYLAELPK